MSAQEEGRPATEVAGTPAQVRQVPSPASPACSEGNATDCALEGAPDHPLPLSLTDEERADLRRSVAAWEHDIGHAAAERLLSLNLIDQCRCGGAKGSHEEWCHRCVGTVAA